MFSKQDYIIHVCRFFSFLLSTISIFKVNILLCKENLFTHFWKIREKQIYFHIFIFLISEKNFIFEYFPNLLHCHVRHANFKTASVFRYDKFDEWNVSRSYLPTYGVETLSAVGLILQFIFYIQLHELNLWEYMWRKGFGKNKIRRKIQVMKSI